MRLIEGMSHKKCLKTLQKSDLYVELGLGGFYGNAAMEAMAFGIPVAVHLKDNVIRQAGSVFEDCPLIPVKQRTIDNFTKVLQPWLENHENLRRQGLRTREWICKVHDEKVVGRKWIELYASEVTHIEVPEMSNYASCENIVYHQYNGKLRVNKTEKKTK
mgnify:CR=1 FL=1